MKSSARRLIAYYESADCAKDFQDLAQRDPRLEREHREALVERLNENFAALGSVPSELDRVGQRRFVAGELSPEQFLAQIKIYTSSIAALWDTAKKR